MNNCPVSIIMPVYNSAPFLENAVNSILNEKSDFELILVDDGSTDGSEAICDALAKKDNRIRVIHKENGGMCQARNAGIDQARGEWIAFVDNDDEVLPGFIDDNIAIAKKYSADCVKFGREIKRYDSNGNLVHSDIAVPASETCFYSADVIGNYPELVKGTDAVWARLYRSATIKSNSIRFNEAFRSGFEDTLFNDQFVEKANSYAFNPNCYYIWSRRASHSSSMKLSQNRTESLKTLIKYEHDLMKEEGILSKRSDWCAGRLFSFVFDCMISGPVAGKPSISEQIELYDQLNSIIAPCRSLLEGSRIRPDLNFAKALLIKRRYRLLFQYLKIGVWAKSKLSR